MNSHSTIAGLACMGMVLTPLTPADLQIHGRTPDEPKPLVLTLSARLTSINVAEQQGETQRTRRTQIIKGIILGYNSPTRNYSAILRQYLYWWQTATSTVGPFQMKPIQERKKEKNGGEHRAPPIFSKKDLPNFALWQQTRVDTKYWFTAYLKLLVLAMNVQLFAALMTCLFYEGMLWPW